MVVDKKIHHDSIDGTEAAMEEFFQHVIATAPSSVEQYIIYILYTIQYVHCCSVKRDVPMEKLAQRMVRVNRLICILRILCYSYCKERERGGPGERHELKVESWLNIHTCTVEKKS